MKKWKQLFRSFYAKLIVLFLGVGLLPLILMGLFIYNTYSATLYSNVLSNYSQMTDLLADNLADYMGELTDATERIYRLDTMDYDYFYELFEDQELPEAAQQTMVLNTLRTILYMNESIDHVIFVAYDGRQYVCMRPPEHLMSSDAVMQWHQEQFRPQIRAVQLIPTHRTEYFLNSERECMTVCRNIMNTSTIQSAGSEILGTLYLGISLDYVQNLVEQAAFGAGHSIYLVDAGTGRYVFHPDGTYDGTNAFEDGNFPQEVRESVSLVRNEPAGIQLTGRTQNAEDQNGKEQNADRPDAEEQDAKKQNAEGKTGKDQTGKQEAVKIGREYFICSQAGTTGWVILDRIDADVIDRSYRMIRNNTFLLIFAVGAVLLTVYLVSSRRLDRPVRELKKAMGRIETGDLDVRVEITSNDEMEDIGKGLNQMVENLSAYIQKAYVAEIRQRDAELEALITQIQPHYLYNTLDVIRMSAITNDDRIVADMISSLSAQLKYLIGASGKMVRLEEEITCIRNYFRLIEVRYEYLYSLRIDIEPSLMDCVVPHLIIQPIVENAIKHGLRPKKDAGEVVVSARKNESFLELTVMDSGIGMTQQRLAQIREYLAGPRQEPETGMSIGIRNVSDRIRLLYGEPYRLELESYEGIGTLVKYWLPLIIRDEQEQQEEQNVSDFDCGR